MLIGHLFSSSYLHLFSHVVWVEAPAAVVSSAPSLFFRNDVVGHVVRRRRRSLMILVDARLSFVDDFNTILNGLGGTRRKVVNAAGAAANVRRLFFLAVKILDQTVQLNSASN